MGLIQILSNYKLKSNIMKKENWWLNAWHIATFQKQGYFPIISLACWGVTLGILYWIFIY